MQIALNTQMTENRRSNEQTNKYYLLKERGSVKVLVDFPHFTQSTNFDTANDCDCDETPDHDSGLKHVCPHHSFQSTLITNQISHQLSNNLASIVCVPRISRGFSQAKG